jgi:hypothetical protein
MLVTCLFCVGSLAARAETALPSGSAVETAPVVATQSPSSGGGGDAASTTSSFDRPGQFGLGVAVEDFGSAVTLKAFLGGPWALQAELGYSYFWLTGFVANADLLYEFPRFVDVPALSMNGYVGAGATAGVGSCGVLSCGTFGYGGGQAVGGVALQLRSAPVEFVAEVRPTFLGLASEYGGGFDWYFGGGVAARYFF